MTQSGNAFRKVFIDSRWRSGGSHNDFSIELPSDVDTSRTTSVYLASCSFSNTFATVLDGVNDNLYAILQEDTNAPRVSAANEWFYMLYKRDRVLPLITESNRYLYFMYAILLGGTTTSSLYAIPLPPGGPYTVEAFASALQLALSSVIPNDGNPQVVWQEDSKTYGFTYVTQGPTLGGWWIPNPLDLQAAVDRFRPTIAPALPVDPTQTVNFLLNMPRLTPAGPFGNTATSGAIAYTQPVGAYRTSLQGLPRPVSFTDLAAALQRVLRAIFGDSATATAQDRALTFSTGSQITKLRIPRDAELRDPQWKAANWPVGPYDYSTFAPASYNAALRLTGQSAFLTTLNTPPLPTTTYAVALPLQRAQYNTGAQLATALQAALATTGAGATVTFDAGLGTLTFAAAAGWLMQFPLERELRDASWRAATWDIVPNAASYSLLDPQSVNAQLYFPFPSSLLALTRTGNIDMVPYREVYLSSSLTNFRTLQAGTGAQDILARVPIDVDYGQVVTFRAYNHDAIGASDQHFRSMRFRFTDYAGRLVPIDQPVILELAFVDSDPYAV